MNSSGGIDSYAKLMDDINFAMAGSASSVPSDAPDAPDASRTGQEGDASFSDDQSMSSDAPDWSTQARQCGTGLEFNRQFAWTDQDQGTAGAYLTVNNTSHVLQAPGLLISHPVPTQQLGPATTISQTVETPHPPVVDPTAEDTNSFATEDTVNASPPADPVDYSWRVVATHVDHAVFGDGGILYGTELRKRAKANGRLLKRLFISPTLENLRVHGDRHGHNGLEVGQWFANRITAYFHGAHGAFQNGIVGTEDGAFSVVVTPAAGITDVDLGYTIFYAGPEGRPGSRGLEKSHRTETAVRVLRAAQKAGDWSWAPKVGIRYDGLYRVVGISGIQPGPDPASEKGSYRQFELQRLPGQIPLEDLRGISPSEEETDQVRVYQDILDSVSA